MCYARAYTLTITYWQVNATAKKLVAISLAGNPTHLSNHPNIVVLLLCFSFSSGSGPDLSLFLSFLSLLLIVGDLYDMDATNTQYSLHITYRPLDWLELVLAFQFDITVYLILFCLIGSVRVRQKEDISGRLYDRLSHFF